MAIESKEILDYLGLSDVEKFDDFRSKFEPVYIKKEKAADDKEIVNSIVVKSIGKVTALTQSALISDIKTMGVDLSKDELKDMPIEKAVEYGLKKVNDFYSSKISELQKGAGSGDEKVKEWETKFTKLQSKYEQEHNLFEQTKQTIEQERQGWQNEKKGIKLTSKVGDALKAIKWKTGATEIEKKGFLALVNEKYKLDLDEKDDLFIADIQGQRIPHPKKHGEFKGINEILEEEGKAANVWEGNPIAGRAGTPQKPIHQNGSNLQQPAFTGGRPRVLNPAAAANEGK